MAETTPSPSSSPSSWEQGEEVNKAKNESLGKSDDDHEKSGASASASSMAMAASMAEDLQRTVMQSTYSAIRSARSLQHYMPLYIGKAVSDYRTYEHAFFTKIKEGLMSARENPAPTLGIGLTAAFLLLPGSRRFFFRQTSDKPNLSPYHPKAHYGYGTSPFLLVLLWYRLLGCRGVLENIFL